MTTPHTTCTTGSQAAATGPTTPMVSVIVPNYNYARYLDLRMESILSQTFSDFEIILLDDKSTDNSAQLIEKYRKHPKVTHIEINAENSGSPFHQWKKGIELARGKYIWIAEADDFAESAFLEKTVAALEANPEASIAFTGSIIIDENGVPSKSDWDKWHGYKSCGGRKAFDGKEYIIHNLLWKNYIYNASMVLFRRDAYAPDMLDDSIAMRNAGDWMFWTKLASRGSVVEVYEKLNRFRRHATSTTVDGDKSGRIRLEEIAVLGYINKNFAVGSYRRRLRIGRFIKSVIKAKHYSPATRREILDTLRREFDTGMSPYLFERLNKTAAAICPLLLTPHRDRL